jgi:hypothetical protein
MSVVDETMLAIKKDFIIVNNCLHLVSLSFIKFLEIVVGRDNKSSTSICPNCDPTFIK